MQYTPRKGGEYSDSMQGQIFTLVVGGSTSSRTAHVLPPDD